MAVATPVDTADTRLLDSKSSNPRFQIVEKPCLKSGIFRHLAPTVQVDASTSAPLFPADLGESFIIPTPKTRHTP
jgi:hypothetical protein